jgi:2,4-dienoyl-CoA reductase-like NADH-dependent reductase (Old Yellow Enzyme family)
VFHASTRRYWQPEFDDSDLNLAGWVKKITGRAVITVGSVGLDMDAISTLAGQTPSATGIDQLLERLERDEFDLVTIGRAVLADPAWAAKVRTVRSNEITPFERMTMNAPL